MKVIISGATSMIGVSLIKSCISNNISVLALVREDSNRIKNIPKSKLVKIKKCSLQNISKLNSRISYDVFFHLGWEGTNKNDRDNMEIQYKNIEYSINAIKIAKKLGCKTFVGVGSQAEYGIKNKKLYSNMIEEPVIAYGVAKLCANKITKKMATELGLKHIWVRVLSVYGPNDNNETLISILIRKMKNNNEIAVTKCEQLWDYLYCDDAGEAIMLIGKYGKNNKIYNLGSGRCKTIKHYIETIKRITNSNSKIKYGKMPYSNNQVMILGTNISEITKDTGWKPTTSFEDGIKNMI